MKSGLPESAVRVSKLRQQNEAAQAVVKRKIAEMEARISREKRNVPGKSVRVPKNLSWVIEIKAAKTEEAERAAQSFAAACHTCGFCPIVSESTNGEFGVGVQIESNLHMAARALLIQGAFRIAGLRAMLTVHDGARHNAVTVHVGETGI